MRKRGYPVSLMQYAKGQTMPNHTSQTYLAEYAIARVSIDQLRSVCTQARHFFAQTFRVSVIASPEHQNPGDFLDRESARKIGMQYIRQLVPEFTGNCFRDEVHQDMYKTKTGDQK